MDIQSRLFGKTKDAFKVYEYTLINDHHCSISLLTYGGIINSIVVPDRAGQLSNIVLGFDTVKDYEEQSPYCGAIVGRFAGRIGGGTFTLNNTDYTLVQNDGTNCLHGGTKGFDKAIWTVDKVEIADTASVRLSYINKDLEEGFPGTLHITVTYTWSNDNELLIAYEATTDKETPITLTNHSYFNLSGNLSHDILDHELLISANKYVETDSNSLPIRISDVHNTPFDFKTAKKVGADIEVNHPQLMASGGYDHPFILDKSSTPHAVLSHPASGRQLTVTTDEEVIVLYTGNYLSSDIKIFNNEALTRRCAICLESQYYPDNMHFDLVPSKTLKPSDTYHSSTSYRFEVLPN
jgi:aldose 1-epimerase